MEREWGEGDVIVGAVGGIQWLTWCPVARRTTTTTVWTCDRCGGKMPNGDDRPYSYTYATLRIAWVSRDALGNGAGNEDQLELCHGCCEGLRAFLDAGRLQGGDRG